MSPLAHILRAFVHVYQWTLSPFIGRQCRYDPTCSNYALEALSRHGALRGSWLTLCRLARCHPWGGWGYDPVPTKEELQRRRTSSRSEGNNGKP